MDLAREKLSSPVFSCDARPFGCNRVGNFTSKVSDDLPMDGRIRIEQPFELGLPGLRNPGVRNLGSAFACYRKWCVRLQPCTDLVPDGSWLAEEGTNCYREGEYEEPPHGQTLGTITNPFGASAQG
jgi:hypothetical protein